MAVKDCRFCKHVCRTQPYPSDTPMAFASCTHPKNIRNGELVYDFAATMRTADRNGFGCGQNGKWFEPREARA